MGREEGMDAVEKMWGVIAAAFVHSREYGESIPSEKSLLDFFRESAESLFDGSDGEDEEGEGVDKEREEVMDGDVKEKKKTIADQRQRMLWMAEFWGAITGSEIEKQSLKFFWLEEGIEGGE